MIRTRAIAVVACVLAVVLASCGGGQGSASNGGGAPSAAQVFHSDDGTADLSIPADAWPAGMDHNSVKITRVAAANADVTAVDGRAPVAIYQLEPAGTQFKKPVSISIGGIAQDGDVVQALLLSTGNQAQLALDTAVVPDSNGSGFRVTTTVPHFSQLVVDENGRLTMQLPDSASLTEPFTATATLSWAGNEAFVMSHKPGVSDVVWRSTERSLAGDFSASNATPAQIKDAPPKSAIGFSFTATGTFTCVKAGQATVTYHAVLTETTDVDPPYQGHSVDAHQFTVTGRVACGPNRPPVVTQLKATLAAPVTTYTVTASDPDGDPLTYQWKMAGEACGTSNVPWTQTGPVVKWSHSDQSPDNCQHTGTDHAVITSVTVSDGRGGSVQCVIVGTETEVIDKPDCK